MLQKTPQSMLVMTGEEYDGNAYTVRMDVLAFGGGGGDRDRVDVRRHSVRYQVRAVGRGRRLHRSSDRVQGQDGLKSARAFSAEVCSGSPHNVWAWWNAQARWPWAAER